MGHILFSKKRLNYKKLLQKIIIDFLEKRRFDLIGKLRWLSPTEKQKKKYLEKNGKQLTKQRISYVIVEDFNSGSKLDSFEHTQLLISEIESDGIFYCICDYITLGNMGQKMRYKFKINNFKNSTNISEFDIDLLEENMIMTR